MPRLAACRTLLACMLVSLLAACGIGAAPLAERLAQIAAGLPEAEPGAGTGLASNEIRDGLGPDDDAVKRQFPNHAEHDPSDIHVARELAEDETALPLGILYHNPDAPRYELMSAVGLEMTAEQRLAGLNEALDHFAI